MVSLKIDEEKLGILWSGDISGEECVRKGELEVGRTRSMTNGGYPFQRGNGSKERVATMDSGFLF